MDDKEKCKFKKLLIHENQNIFKNVPKIRNQFTNQIKISVKIATLFQVLASLLKLVILQESISKFFTKIYWFWEQGLLMLQNSYKWRLKP